MPLPQSDTTLLATLSTPGATWLSGLSGLPGLSSRLYFFQLGFGPPSCHGQFLSPACLQQPGLLIKAKWHLPATQVSSVQSSLSWQSSSSLQQCFFWSCLQPPNLPESQ